MEDKTTLHFLVLRQKLVSYFASIKSGVTIVFTYGNMLHLMTTLFFVKLRKKITNNFRNLFDAAFGLMSAGNDILRLSVLKIFLGGGGGGACPKTSLEARAFGARKSCLHH